MSLGLRLTRAIAPQAEAAGFRHSKKRNTFVRKEPHGFSEFLWTTYPTVSRDVPGQQYSLVIGVRHDSVEDAVNQLGLIFGSDNQKATATVETPLANFPLSTEGQYSYFLPNMATDEEVGAVARSIASHLAGDISAYFMRYASLKECAIGLNSEPSAQSHHLYNNLEPRMYRAIASAYYSSCAAFDALLERWQPVYSSALPITAQAKAKDRISKLLSIMGVGPNNSFKPTPLRGAP